MAASDHVEQARESILTAARLLERSGVMSPTGHVNMSARLDPRSILLSSRGVIHDLTADDLSVVGLDGQVSNGRLAASTWEILGMHTAVYRVRADVGAVVHTHSPHLTAFALTGRGLPCRYEPMLRRGQGGPVPVVPWAPRGSDDAVQAIIDLLHEHPTTSAVLLSNHGVLAFSRSPVAATKLLIVLEEAATAEIAAAAIGGSKDLPAGAFHDVQRSMTAARRATGEA